MEDVTEVVDSSANGEPLSDTVNGVSHTAESESRRATVEEAEDDNMPGICQPGQTYGCCTTRYECFKAVQSMSSEEPWSPFANFDEWCLAKWMVSSGLSQGEIDKFLKLKIVSKYRNRRYIQCLHIVLSDEGQVIAEFQIETGILRHSR
jgi:hypothetical protein